MTRSEEECDHGQIISLCNYHRLRGREEILETILSHIKTIPAAASFDFFVRISGTISLKIRTVKSSLVNLFLNTHYLEVMLLDSMR